MFPPARWVSQLSRVPPQMRRSLLPCPRKFFEKRHDHTLHHKPTIRVPIGKHTPANLQRIGYYPPIASSLSLRRSYGCSNPLVGRLMFPNSPHQELLGWRYGTKIWHFETYDGIPTDGLWIAHNRARTSGSTLPFTRASLARFGVLRAWRRRSVLRR